MSPTMTTTSSPFPLRRRLTGILDDKPENEMAQILTSLQPPSSPASPLRRRLSGILDDKQLATPQELAMVKQLHDSQLSSLTLEPLDAAPTSPTSSSTSQTSLRRRRMTGIFDEPGARELAMMEQLRFDSSSSSSQQA